MFTDIFAALASSSAPNVYETVVKQALPTLCTSIGSANANESWITGSAIDLISSLVRGAPEGGLGDGFFALLAPNLFECLKQAEDRDVLQVKLLFSPFGLKLIRSWLIPEWRCMPNSCHPQRLQSASIVV